MSARLESEERALDLLEQILRGLADAEARNNEFVALASHELRTPISVVHGIAATLHLRGDELQRGQVHELRATLFEQTGRLRDLADQLLDLSRLDAEPLLLALEPFRPRERLDALLPRIAAGRLDDIEVKVDPEHEVTTDVLAFERVTANLILNALRYGQPPVEVKAVRSEVYSLVVEDHGDGVAPEFVPRLFERFSRGEVAGQPGAPGAGLGLAIAFAYARAVGGALRYEKVRPRGARFTFTRPGARRGSGIPRLPRVDPDATVHPPDELLADVEAEPGAAHAAGHSGRGGRTSRRSAAVRWPDPEPPVADPEAHVWSPRRRARP